jgi:hypothetical protein
VVAQEIRALAQRSAEAAREIKSLIEASATAVDEGTRLVHETGRTIDDVSAGVEETNELIGVIAIASREQSNGVEGINKAVVQLQGLTQKNAGLVQDAAVASVELKEEAVRLEDLVGRFRLTRPEFPPGAGRRPAPGKASKSSACRGKIPSYAGDSVGQRLRRQVRERQRLRSASANALFAKAILRMGVPVSPRNIFPSNIQGLPTWYEVRVSERGWLGRRGGGVDLMVAMNPRRGTRTWPKSNRAAISSTTRPSRCRRRSSARTSTSSACR